MKSKQLYGLYNVATGERIIQQKSDLPALVWQRRIIKKLLRFKRTPERTKEVIRSGEILTGWDNYDGMRAVYSGQAMAELIETVFKGYPK